MSSDNDTLRYRQLKADYEAVRAGHANLPPYDSLTDEQKANHEMSYDEKRRFFDDLGDAIRTGGPLPKLNDYWQGKRDES